LDYFSNRFGIPEKAFEGLRILKGERKIWVVRIIRNWKESWIN